MATNTLTGNPVDCTNELDGECSNATTGNVIAAGVTTNTIQLRSSTGTFTANDNFYFNSDKAISQGTIYQLVNVIPLTSTFAYTDIPSWAKRISINFTRLSTTSTGSPVIRLGGPSNTINLVNLGGATWGNANTSTQVQWLTNGIYLTNSPSTWTASLVVCGRCVIEKIGSIAGISYYSIDVQNSQTTVGNMSFGAGKYSIADYIGYVQLFPLSGAFDAGEWSLSIE